MATMSYDSTPSRNLSVNSGPPKKRKPKKAKQIKRKRPGILGTKNHYPGIR